MSKEPWGRGRKAAMSKEPPNPERPNLDTAPSSDLERPNPDNPIADTLASRKRIWGVTDPFEFPPCEYNRRLLETIEPLLQVHARGVLPEFDKFAGHKMNHQTLKAAVRILVNQYPSTSRLFSMARTELNIRSRHTALLQNLYLLTRPNSHDRAVSHLKMYGQNTSIEGLRCSSETGSSETEAQDNVSGLLIKGGGEMVCRERGSSNEGLDIDHEAATEDEDTRRSKGRADFRAFVWDKAPLKQTNLPDFLKKKIDLKRLALVFESKLDDEVDACSQAAGYARPGILRNLEHWHVQPVYLIMFAKDRWTYGILDVHGSLMVNDNNFTEADFEAFKEQEKARWGNAHHQGISSDELKARLKFGLAQFRGRYKEKPQASLPTQKYLVGDYYESDEWFPLPMVGTENGLCTRGSLKFYEGLLRVIVGERILQWTPHDVQAACDIQLDLHEEVNEIEGLEPTLQELEHAFNRVKQRLQKKRRRLGVVEELE